MLAIDKPRGWMLVPFSWQKTNRNLQAALTSSIAAGDFWARSRGLKFLRFVHRLDADTSGILLLARSPGAVKSFGALFESRRMEKVYLAVVNGTPKLQEWSCRLKLGPDHNHVGKMRVDSRAGKEAETQFRVLETRAGKTLVEARPYTGRTHQIRVHLVESGCAILGDRLYGRVGQASQEFEDRARSPLLAAQHPESDPDSEGPVPEPARRGLRAPRDPGLALRAVRLTYLDPFVRRRVDIRAPMEQFLKEHGFGTTKDNAARQQAPWAGE